MSDNALVLSGVNDERSVTDVVAQVQKIQELMSKVMKKDEHYGIIPGTGKKSCLLKAGAEKLCFVFRLSPEFEIATENFPSGHREYRVVCRLRNMTTGTLVGEGVGSCSTMESKYRYRNAGDYEVSDLPIPEDAKERKAEYRKQGYGMKQIDGVWSWVKYKSGEKVENSDIADTYNTVLKMAKKRAHIDATITATAASDIFTQDLEPEPGDEDLRPGKKSEATPPKKADMSAKEEDFYPRMKAAKELAKSYIAATYKNVLVLSTDEIDLANKKLLNLDMDGKSVLVTEANAKYLESVRDEYKKLMDKRIEQWKAEDAAKDEAKDAELDEAADGAFVDDPLPADKKTKGMPGAEGSGLF